MRPHYLAMLFIATTTVIVLLSFVLVFTSQKKELNKISLPQIPTVENTEFKPVLNPLREEEADSTLLMTDTDIQTTLNQTDQDLNEIKNTDTSADNQSI